MRSRNEAENQLAELRSERATGCLTITSTDGRACRLYLLGGRIYHAVGPDATGDAAMAKALTWPTPDLSFDPDAELPDEQTVTDTGAVAEEAGTPRFGRLTEDRRLAWVGKASVIVFAAIIVAPITIGGIGIVVFQLGGDGEPFLLLAVLSVLVLGAAWCYLYFRFRIVYLRDAVRMPGAASTEIPRVFDTPGIVSGRPQLAVTMQTRSTLGRHGRCRIELYREGVQIWRGPAHPEPRWQLSYGDIAQVEAVDVVSVESMGNNTETFVRLIARRPPVAFLFGGGWISVVTRQNRDAALLLGRLERHGVTSFDDETLEA